MVQIGHFVFSLFLTLGVGGVGLGSFSGIPFPGPSDSSSGHSKGFEWGLSAVVNGVV